MLSEVLAYILKGFALWNKNARCNQAIISVDRTHTFGFNVQNMMDIMYEGIRLINLLH